MKKTNSMIFSVLCFVSVAFTSSIEEIKTLSDDVNVLSNEEIAKIISSKEILSSKEKIWLDFDYKNWSESGFYFQSNSLNIYGNGYKNLNNDVNFFLRIDEKTLPASMEVNIISGQIVFKMENITMKLERIGFSYKVSGQMLDNGVAIPLNFIIKGAIRERAYSISMEGLELNIKKDKISGFANVSTDKKFISALVCVMSALMTEDIFGILKSAGNYPNPFSQDRGVTFFYDLSMDVDSVEIIIYDIHGKEIKKIYGNTCKGKTEGFWDGREIPSNYPSYMGRKIVFWQIEIKLKQLPNKVLRQYSMELY